MVRKDSTPLDVAVAELAEAQWGVVTLAQLRALGLGARAVQRRCVSGRLRRLHRGVYAVGHRVLRPEGRRLAAVLACGPGAVLSHRSAAAHWELLGSAAAVVDVTAPVTRSGAPGIRLHRSRSLAARDATSHRGIPITTVARTLLELAATVRSDRLERALAQAQRLQLYDHNAITGVLTRANGHWGAGALARATAIEPQLTRSELEARFLKLVRDAGMPEPMTNLVLAAPDNPRLEVDACWPAHHLIVELDGWETHRTRAAFEADRRRDAALQAAGWRVLRFTLSAEETIVRRLQALLHH
jgi:predicted transcriptional regulator of viral defense system